MSGRVELLRLTMTHFFPPRPAPPFDIPFSPIAVLALFSSLDWLYSFMTSARERYLSFIEMICLLFRYPPPNKRSFYDALCNVESRTSENHLIVFECVVVQFVGRKIVVFVIFLNCPLSDPYGCLIMGGKIRDMGQL